MTLSDSPNVVTKGGFQIGTSALFYLTFPDIDGDLFDPSDININIADSNDTVVATSTTVERLDVGEYAYEWDIPSDGSIDPGLYSLQVTYIVNDGTGPVSSTYEENFTVTEAGANYQDQQKVAGRILLESLLGEFQHLPIYNEIGRFRSDGKTALFTFGRWNQSAGVRVYLNGRMTDISHSVDFYRGRINFTKPVSEWDQLTADYNFRWFSNDELDIFINQALQVFNNYAPHTMYTIGRLPTRFGETIIMQATVFALRRLMMDLLCQQPAKVFGGMDRADKLIGHLETLKQNYENELKDLYEQKKYGPYVGLHKAVVVPEYTLPGGRSRWFRYLFKGA